MKERVVVNLDKDRTSCISVNTMNNVSQTLTIQLFNFPIVLYAYKCILHIYFIIHIL